MTSCCPVLVMLPGRLTSTDVFQVLSSYWDMSTPEVEDMMDILVKKSLVQEMQDAKTDSMLYSMHDLIIDYMAKKYSAKEVFYLCSVQRSCISVANAIVAYFIRG